MEQGQQRDDRLDLGQFDQGIAAGARRPGDSDVVDRKRDRGQQGDVDVAADRDVATGHRLELGLDLGLVLVEVDRHQDNPDGDDDHHDKADKAVQELAHPALSDTVGGERFCAAVRSVNLGIDGARNKREAKRAMGDLIDFDAYRRKRAEEARDDKPRRRKTPGGRGFNEDITSQLSIGVPSPTGEGDGDDPRTPAEAIGRPFARSRTSPAPKVVVGSTDHGTRRHR